MTRQKDMSEGLSMGLWSQWSPCSWPPEDEGASGCSRGAPLMCHHPFPMPLFPVESQGTQKEGEVLGALLLQEWLWILRDGGPSSMSAGFSTRRKKRRIVTSSPSRTFLNLEIATKALNTQTERILSHLRIQQGDVFDSQDPKCDKPKPSFAKPIRNKHKVCVPFWNIDSPASKGPL